MGGRPLPGRLIGAVAMAAMAATAAMLFVRARSSGAQAWHAFADSFAHIAG